MCVCGGGGAWKHKCITSLQPSLNMKFLAGGIRLFLFLFGRMRGLFCLLLNCSSCCVLDVVVADVSSHSCGTGVRGKVKYSPLTMSRCHQHV